MTDEPSILYCDETLPPHDYNANIDMSECSEEFVYTNGTGEMSLFDLFVLADAHVVEKDRMLALHLLSTAPIPATPPPLFEAAAAESPIVPEQKKKKRMASTQRRAKGEFNQIAPLGV